MTCEIPFIVIFISLSVNHESLTKMSIHKRDETQAHHEKTE